MNKLHGRPSAAIAVDAVVFGYHASELKVALIERAKDPFKGSWALPGGFLEGDEDAWQGMMRELKEETSLQNVYLEQFHCFTKPGRDPRGRVISIAFLGLMNFDSNPMEANHDAANARWWPLNSLPALAFDHAEVLAKAYERLKEQVKLSHIIYELLPEKFSLSQLQSVYEVILDISLDKRNFRKKVAAFEFVEGLNEKTSGRHRPAQLFRFNAKKFFTQKEKGFYFGLS